MDPDRVGGDKVKTTRCLLIEQYCVNKVAKKGLILRSVLKGIPVSRLKFKRIRGDNWSAKRVRGDESNPGPLQNHFFLAALGAAVWVTDARLASAKSVACLTAFCTDSKAVLAALTAPFIMATACSEPAGAF